MTSTNALRVRSFTHHTPIQRASTRTNWRKTKKLVKSLILINYFIPFTKMLCVCFVCVDNRQRQRQVEEKKWAFICFYFHSFLSLSLTSISMSIIATLASLAYFVHEEQKKILEPKPKLKVEPWHSHKNMWEQEHKTENKTRWKRGIRNVLSRLIYVTMIIWNINKRRIEQRC